METYKPVTIGMLRTRGRVLEAHCNECCRFVELDANALPFDDDQPVPTAGKRMRCSVCGSRNVMTRPQVGEITIAEHRARVLGGYRRGRQRAETEHTGKRTTPNYPVPRGI